MTHTHNDVTETAYTARRRQLARVFTVGALAAGAVVALAVPAQAAGTGASDYPFDGAWRSGSHSVADPGNPTLVDGTTTTECGVRGSGMYGDCSPRQTSDCSQTTPRSPGRAPRSHNGWHHNTAPVTGYDNDDYTDARGTGRFTRGGMTCPTTTPGQPDMTSTIPATTPGTAPGTPANTTPATAPAVTRGATMDYNEGVGGSCVYYALNRFHDATGVYPKAIGDARLLATGAAASGWSVGSTPRVDSIVIFQPGQNGASAPYGHAAWVEQVSGDRIYIAEMNAPTAWVVTHRWLTPVAGVKYIYTS